MRALLPDPCDEWPELAVAGGGAGEPASPCTGMCRLDGATGWCLGCGRTMDEIERWPAASAAERDAILRELPSRCRYLPRSECDTGLF